MGQTCETVFSPESCWGVLAHGARLFSKSSFLVRFSHHLVKTASLDSTIDIELIRENSTSDMQYGPIKTPSTASTVPHHLHMKYSQQHVIFREFRIEKAFISDIGQDYRQKKAFKVRHRLAPSQNYRRRSETLPLLA